MGTLKTICCLHCFGRSSLWAWPEGETPWGWWGSQVLEEESGMRLEFRVSSLCQEGVRSLEWLGCVCDRDREKERECELQ